MSAIQEVTRLINGAKVTLSLDEETLFRNWLDAVSGRSSGFIDSIPNVGDFWPAQGGVNLGLMRRKSARPYWLIAPTDPAAEKEAIEYGGHGVDESGATDEFDGLANTLALAESKTDHPAAQWAVSVAVNGFRDLYIPSKREGMLAAANAPEIFKPGWHGLSTQYSANFAYVQLFDDGFQGLDLKDSQYRFRLVRRFDPLILR